MPRLAQDVIVVSQPVRTFPNGDFFYVELSRKHNRYDCLLKMARNGNRCKIRYRRSRTGQDDSRS